MYDHEAGGMVLDAEASRLDRNMNSIVLAGGKSSRLGRNKLVESVGGRPLLDRVLDIVGHLTDQVILVIARDQELPPLPENLHPLVEADIYPGKGALGGIYTGILASRSLHSLVVGADMPFLNPGLLRFLMGLAPGFDVVMPAIGPDIEPLHAVYSRRCAWPMRSQIESGDLTIRHFLDQVSVRYVTEEEIDVHDPQHLSFFNVNTMLDLKRAEELAVRGPRK